MRFLNDGKKIDITDFEDKKTHEQLKSGTTALFELILQDSSVITSNDFRLSDPPLASDIPGNPAATNYAEKLPGKKYSANLKKNKGGSY